MGRKKRFSSNNAASASRVQTDHETNDVNVDGGRVFPESAGMSKSFIDVFYSSSTPPESVNLTSNIVGIGENAQPMILYFRIPLTKSALLSRTLMIVVSYLRC